VYHWRCQNFVVFRCVLELALDIRIAEKSA
jgi:hypothetical protein